MDAHPSPVCSSDSQCEIDRQLCRRGVIALASLTDRARGDGDCAWPLPAMLPLPAAVRVAVALVTTGQPADLQWLHLADAIALLERLSGSIGEVHEDADPLATRQVELGPSCAHRFRSSVERARAEGGASHGARDAPARPPLRSHHRLARRPRHRNPERLAQGYGNAVATVQEERIYLAAPDTLLARVRADRWTKPTVCCSPATIRASACSRWPRPPPAGCTIS